MDTFEEAKEKRAKALKAKKDDKGKKNGLFDENPKGNKKHRVNQLRQLDLDE